MNVFRHEHKGVKPKVGFDAGLVDLSGQFPSPMVVGKQWFPLVTGKCQLVKVTRFMKPFQAFSMCGASHGSILERVPLASPVSDSTAGSRFLP